MMSKIPRSGRRLRGGKGDFILGGLYIRIMYLIFRIIYSQNMTKNGVRPVM